MSRVDENKKLLSNIEKNRPKSGSFEEIVCWDLGTISSLLADISVSLAGICDSLEDYNELRAVRPSEEGST